MLTIFKERVTLIAQILAKLKTPKNIDNSLKSPF